MRSLITFLAISIMPLNICAASFPLSDSTWIDQTYGDFNLGQYHDGLDFPLKEIDSVYSPVSGTIVDIVPHETNPYYSYIVIQSPAPYYWLVGHIVPNANLKKWDPVVAGVTDIGVVAPGPYRHWPRTTLYAERKRSGRGGRLPDAAQEVVSPAVLR